MPFNNTIDLKIKNTICNICNEEFKYFLNKCNVVGIGLGYKLKSGFYTNTPCIKVFVRKKLPCNKISKFNLIPLTYKGIKTDIIESGIPVASSLKSRIRPVIGGYSIGNINNNHGGTLGCLVTNGHKNFFLSNNHVIANENKSSIGAPISQPALSEGGHLQTDIIGYLEKYVPLQFATHSSTPINLSDCAMASLSDPKIVSPSIAYIGKIKGIHNVYVNQSVQKIGCESGRTFGNIVAINITTQIVYPSGTVLFKNQIATNLMSAKGDSGSILLDKQNYALGLLCSDSNSESFYSPIDVTLSLLGVHLVTK